MTNDETVVTEINITASSDYSLQWNRWAMKSIGAWPQSSSNLERIISRILNVICYTAVLFTIIPCSLHVMLEKETFYTKVKILGPLSHWVFCIISYTMLLLRRKTIRHFFNHMETDWRTTTRKEKKEIMLKYAKFSRYAAIFCAIFIHGGILGYCTMTAFTTMVVVVGNETTILRVLPLPMYKGLLPVDTNTMNEIVLLSQFLSGFIANTSAISVISLTSALTSHASGQLGVVMLSIEDFVSDARRRGKNDHFDEIPTIVEKHLRVLNFISRIEAMMNKACFLELMRCTIAICVLGYYIFMEWTESDAQMLITYFVTLVAVVSNTFLICYISDRLTEQCLKVGEVVYMTDWYYLPQRRILDLILIITRSNVVVEITAGKIFHMSLYTFGDVVKTGFAYLNMLCQMS